MKVLLAALERCAESPAKPARRAKPTARSENTIPNGWRQAKVPGLHTRPPHDEDGLKAGRNHRFPRPPFKRITSARTATRASAQTSAVKGTLSIVWSSGVQDSRAVKQTGQRIHAVTPAAVLPDSPVGASVSLISPRFFPHELSRALT